MRLTLACLVLASAVACAAPPEGGLSAPLASKLSGSGHEEETFLADDGTMLYAQAWRPRRGDLRGVLVVVHGLRDHSARYAPLARALTRRGYGVYAMDLRGHGRSHGQRAHIERFGQYVDDLSLFVHKVRSLEPRSPIFVLGHDMGGTVAALFAERPRPRIAGLILSAPAIEIGATRLETCGANLVRDMTPYAKRLHIPMDRWSHDERVVRQNLSDPLVYQEPATITTAAELLSAAELALQEAPFIHIPVLVLHGAEDTITLPSGSASFVAQVRSRDKELEIYPDLFHDLFHEPERNAIFADIGSWLDDHTAPEEPGDGDLDLPSAFELGETSWVNDE